MAVNPFGSYRALRDHSIAAMLSAIEIYNKPRVSYRSECFTILAINAWELLLKAILSKNRCRIFYPKKRGQPYITVGLLDAIDLCRPYFPKSLPHKPVAANLTALNDFRNNSVHFYNAPDFDVLVYGLGQTAIVNYRDLLKDCLAYDIASDVNLSLMPLSFRCPPDPIKFLADASQDPQGNAHLSAYVSLIADTTRELESEGHDTGRFLTVFSVSLQSMKKIEAADIVAGVQQESPSNVLLVDRRVDPNKSHPKLRKHIIAEVGNSLHGLPFSQYTFEAIAWKLGLKEDSRYCWTPDHGGSKQYSAEVVAVIKRLTKREVMDAIAGYKTWLREQQLTR